MDKAKSNVVDFESIKRKQKEKQKLIDEKNKDLDFEELREIMRRETGYYE